MRVEVLLSAMNIKKSDLDKMNISSKCTVINQCDKKGFRKYKNFNIYSFNESGVSKSRNRGLDIISEDIILFCDDDVVYNNDFEKKVINEFKNNKDADAIIFNFVSPNRKKRILKKRKRLHIYNSLNYATYNIAVRRRSIANIRFNTSFGPGAKYSNGSDTLFIVDIYKNHLHVYSSPIFLGTAYNEKSTWFKGYNEKFFYNKGVLFTAINRKVRHLLILQFLVRQSYMWKEIGLFKAFKNMLKGSKDYLNDKCSNTSL